MKVIAIKFILCQNLENIFQNHASLISWHQRKYQQFTKIFQTRVKVVKSIYNASWTCEKTKKFLATNSYNDVKHRKG